MHVTLLLLQQCYHTKSVAFKTATGNQGIFSRDGGGGPLSFVLNVSSAIFCRGARPGI